MRVWTVHARDAGLFAEPEVVVVKEGFGWPAFFFTVLWALWQRMWLIALLLLLVQIGLGAAADAAGLSATAQTALTLAFMLFVGFSANDWRRRSLRRRRFEESGVVVARDRNAAEWRWFAAQSAAP